MKGLIFGVFAMLATLQLGAQDNSYAGRLNEQYTTGLFRNSNAYMIDATGDQISYSYRNVFQYLIGKIPGLAITENGLNIPFVRYRNGRPAYFIDEIRVDAAAIALVNMSDIALIKVFRPPFAGAFGGGTNGAIAVYTKDGSEEGEEE